jgi:hypothetical protein
LSPAYVANDIEFHVNIVSEHAGPVNADKSPNAAVQLPRAAVVGHVFTRDEKRSGQPLLMTFRILQQAAELGPGGF